MTNPVLSKFFSDPSVPADKKASAMSKLEKGEATEDDLAAAISNIYAKKGVAIGTASVGAKKVPEPGFGERLATNLKRAVDPTDPKGYFQAAFKPAAKITLAPIGRTIAAPVVGAGKAIETGFLGGDAKTMAEPVDVPFFGNINPYRADTETGEVSAMKTLQAQAGQTLEAGGSLLSLVNPAMSVRRALATGAAIGAGAEMQEEGSTIGSTVTAGVTGGAAGAVFQKLLGPKKPVDAKAIIKEAADIGIEPATYKMALDFTPEEKILQKKFLDQSYESAVNKAAKAPTEEVAEKYLTTGLRRLKELERTRGKEIGAIKGATIKGSKEPSNDVAPIVNSFKEKLEKKGVVFAEEGPEFGESSFAGSGGDETLLKNIWTELSKNKGKLSDSRILTLVDTIDNLTGIGKVAGKDIGAAKAFATEIRGDLKKIIHHKNPELAELDKVFSELKKTVVSGMKKTKSTADVLEDEYISGANAWNFLRRAGSAANKEHQMVLKKIQDIGAKYGIEELKGIEKLAQMAKAAEDVVGLDALKSTSFAGQTKQAIQSAQAVATGGDVMRVLDAAARYLPTKTAYDRFEKLLTEPGVFALIAKEATSRLDVTLSRVKQARGAPLPTISGAIADVVDDFIFGREDQFQTE